MTSVSRIQGIAKQIRKMKVDETKVDEAKVDEAKVDEAKVDEALWEILWKSHIRPHLEHAIQAWSPYQEGDIKVLERMQRRVIKHINGMKGLSYVERLDKLGWTTLEDRRRRGDLIFTYQVLHQGALVDLNWHWVQPIRSIDGPTSGVRTARPNRVEPPLFKNCKQRASFLTCRIEPVLRNLPDGILNE
jgi:hypothetical protein